MYINKKQIAFQTITALAIGLITGILTVIGQKYLPGSLNSLANSGAVWLIPAFFVAAWAKRMVPSIVLCIEVLAVCLVAYYAFEAMMNNHSFELGGFYFYLWLSCAVVFGAVFGMGAFLYSQKKRRYHSGASLLPAVFFAEGLSELIHLPGYMHMIPAVIGRIIVGIALYFIIYKKESLGCKPLSTFGILSLLGLLGFELIYRLAA